MRSLDSFRAAQHAEVLTVANRLARRAGQEAFTAVALLLGDVTQGHPLVRIHSQCITSEAFDDLGTETELFVAANRCLSPEFHSYRPLWRFHRPPAESLAGNPGIRRHNRFASCETNSVHALEIC